MRLVCSRWCTPYVRLFGRSFVSPAVRPPASQPASQQRPLSPARPPACRTAGQPDIESIAIIIMRLVVIMTQVKQVRSNRETSDTRTYSFSFSCSLCSVCVFLFSFQFISLFLRNVRPSPLISSPLLASPTRYVFSLSLSLTLSLHGVGNTPIK